MQMAAHVLHLHQQLGNFVPARGLHALRNITRRNRLRCIVGLFEAGLHALQQGQRQQRGRQPPQQHAQHKHPHADLVTRLGGLIGLIRLRDLQPLEGPNQSHQHVTLFAPNRQKARHQVIAEVSPLHAADQFAQLGVPVVLHAHDFGKHVFFHAVLNHLIQLLLPLQTLAQAFLDQIQMLRRRVVVQRCQRAVSCVLKRQQHLSTRLQHTFVDRVRQQNAL